MNLLAKIIPLLGSNQPGEVAAAAAACERVLRQGGRDWHWLAGVASGNGTYSMFNDRGEVQRLTSQVARLTAEMHALRSSADRLRDENRRLVEGNASLIAEVGRLRRAVETDSRVYVNNRRRKPAVRINQPVGKAQGRGRWAQRARMMLDDADFYLSREDRHALEALRSTCTLFEGFSPPPDAAERFEALWRRYRGRDDA